MRVALHSLLHHGQEEAYEREHRRVPDDLLQALKQAGIRDWTIWRSGRHLFHVVDVVDFDAAMSRLDGDPVNERWQKHMAAFVERFELDDETGGMPIRHVWTLSEQDEEQG